MKMHLRDAAVAIVILLALVVIVASATAVYQAEQAAKPHLVSQSVTGKTVHLVTAPGTESCAVTLIHNDQVGQFRASAQGMEVLFVSQDENAFHVVISCLVSSGTIQVFVADQASSDDFNLLDTQVGVAIYTYP